MTTLRRRARAAQAVSTTPAALPEWLRDRCVDAWVRADERPPADWQLGDELWLRVTADRRYHEAKRRYAAEHGMTERELNAAMRVKWPADAEDLEPLPTGDELDDTDDVRDARCLTGRNRS